MNAELSYSEIEGVLKQSTNQEICLTPVSESAVNVSAHYLVNISADLKIIGITDNKLHVEYNVRKPIIGGNVAANTILNVIPSNIIAKEGENRLSIDLSKIKSLEKATEILSLNDITFSQSAVTVKATLK